MTWTSLTAFSKAFRSCRCRSHHSSHLRASRSLADELAIRLAAKDGQAVSAISWEIVVSMELVIARTKKRPRRWARVGGREWTADASMTGTGFPSTVDRARFSRDSRNDGGRRSRSACSPTVNAGVRRVRTGETPSEAAARRMGGGVTGRGDSRVG